MPPVPSSKNGSPGARRRPERRSARPGERQLEQSTQCYYVTVVTHLWSYALDLKDVDGLPAPFDPLPLLDPTGSLKWRARHKRPNQAVAFTLEALETTEFVPASGRSRFEYERDLMLATVYASVTTRNTEVREATWRGAQV
ncbi:MAG: hypothetical protein KGJ98_12865 [Chloroflexota bacterium]|nr:hypothetical protein [Chloroflexota bacterium]